MAGTGQVGCRAGVGVRAADSGGQGGKIKRGWTLHKLILSLMISRRQQKERERREREKKRDGILLAVLQGGWPVFYASFKSDQPIF